MTKPGVNTQVRLTASVRLSNGGLHLGHLFGNLLPIGDHAADTRCVFVIKDTEPYHWKSREAKQSALAEMVADVLASPFSDRIKVVVASRLLARAPNLHACVLDATTFNRVRTVHVGIRDVPEAGKPSPSIRNFLYPVDEVTVALALGTTHVCANDDNNRLVHLAKETAKKLSTTTGVHLTRPVLAHNRLAGRLLGTDYRRMSKASGNAIRIAEEDNTLRAKCVEAASFKQFFDEWPGERERYSALGASYSFPESFLPFYYQRMLCDTSPDEEERRSLSRQGNSPLAACMYGALTKLLGPLRESSQRLVRNPKLLLEKLETDSEEIAHEVGEQDLQFLDGVFNR